jgi:hypothetical protein
MEYKLTESELQKIEDFLTESLNSLEQLTETKVTWDFPKFESLEESLEQLYQSHYPEISEITHNVRKNYKDAVYYGDVLGSNRHGLGKMDYHSGRIYYGEWRDDIRHGLGIENYPNGNYFRGEFSNGVPSGLGHYSWHTGETYTGEWLDGKKHGKGIWKSQKEFYIGEWAEGKQEGKGKHYVSDTI